MSKPTVYYSGNMTPSYEMYYHHGKLLQEGISSKYVLSLPDIEDFFHNEKFVVRHDIARISKSDLLVLNLGLTDTNHHLTGSIVEVYEAYTQGIPVYAYTPEDMVRSKQANSPWLKHFITHDFGTYEDLVDFLLFQENLV